MTPNLDDDLSRRQLIAPESLSVVTTTGAAITPLPSLDQVRQYVRASKSENTLRGYQSDWRAFCAWCEVHQVCPVPATPETVAAYISRGLRLPVFNLERAPANVFFIGTTSDSSVLGGGARNKASITIADDPAYRRVSPYLQ